MVITQQPLNHDHWCPVGRSCKTQDYYVVRGTRGTPTPWGRVVDPDGVVRDRLSEDERQQYIDDMWEELAFLRGRPAGAVCDVGCGPGWLLRELGADWVRVGVEIAQDAVAELHKHGIQHVTGTIELPPCSMDVVVAYHVIEHMTDPLYEICRIREVLKPGGWLILGTPDFGSPCAVRFGDKYRLLHDPTHVSLFTCESMHRFLRENGFTIQDVRFPFPARYATPANFMRWLDTSQVSPPWPGNWMTFYCQR